MTLLAAALPTQASHEPAYTVVRQLGGAEIRQYAPYVVAEVQVPGPAGKAGNQAFPILAAYIFGNNRGREKFAMTAPVTQAAAPTRMVMTAPVVQAASGNAYTVQFVLPIGGNLASAPEPLDARVHLREVPANRLAAIRFSGFWSENNYDDHLADLMGLLRAANLPWTGEPVYSRYNPPFTPWFMRRNEIWLTVH